MAAEQMGSNGPTASASAVGTSGMHGDGRLIAHPLAAGPALLRFYGDAIASTFDELTVFVAPRHARRLRGRGLCVLPQSDRRDRQRERRGRPSSLSRYGRNRCCCR
jgi:hypothetical protein